MNINDYKQAVVELFKSGKATENQWIELGEAILLISELEDSITRVQSIDNTIDPFVTCRKCLCENLKKK